MEVRGVERYQPEKLPQLERNLEEQAAGAAKWSLDVAAAVLRLYQLQPAVARKELIAKALLRSMAELPRPDYRALLQLLPEKLVTEEPVSSVVLLAQHLEASNLQAFWLAAGACRDVIKQVPGFEDAVRAYVLRSVVGAAFQRIHARTLGEWLRLDAGALQQLLQEKVAREGWVVDGDIVRLPLNASNRAEQKRAADLVPFESVAPVVRGVVLTV